MRTKSFISKARAERLILESINPKLSFSKTLFIGFYNGENYIEAIENQVATQDLTELKIVVADNASEDRTWYNLEPWLNRFAGQITLVKNPINVGAAGTLALNIDLFEGKWFTAFHQDDYYDATHLQTLDKSFQEDKALDCVFTEMGSLNQDRIVAEPAARPYQFLRNHDRESMFLGNIRTHIISWPSAGFNIEKFARNISPWHSAAFADTEIALNLSMNSKVKHLNAITMHYMENPESESHSLPEPEVSIGAALGLVRVFSGMEFHEFVKKIDISKRAEFARKLGRAVHARLDKSELANFVNLFANERLNEIWEYSEPTTLEAMAKIYEDLSSQRTSKLLHDIAGFMSKENRRNLIGQSKKTTGNDDYKNEWDIATPKTNDTYKIRGKMRRILSFAFRIITNAFPRRFRRKIRLTIKKLYVKIQPNHPWNFE